MSADLCFPLILSFFFLFCRVISKLAKQNPTKELLHLFSFTTTFRVNGKYLLKETWHRQSEKDAGKYEGSPTLPQYCMNFGPQTAENRAGLSTHPHYFVLSQSIAHPLSGTSWAPHSDFIWNCIGFICSSDLKFQVLSGQAALSGNPSL